jgi:hypothetical protein
MTNNDSASGGTPDDTHPSSPDWTPDNDLRPTVEVPTEASLPPSPSPVASEPSSPRGRRWVFPAALVAGALLAGMFGGAVASSAFDDVRHDAPWELGASGGPNEPDEQGDHDEPGIPEAPGDYDDD